MIVFVLSFLLCFITPMPEGVRDSGPKTTAPMPYDGRNTGPENTVPLPGHSNSGPETTCADKGLCRENEPQRRPTIVLHPHEELACCGKQTGPDGKHRDNCKKAPHREEAASQKAACREGTACLEGYHKVFLAGTIDGGDSVDWQAEAEKFFIHRGGWAVFNPRQKEWHPERPGEMDFQVNWELDHLEQADVILMYFADGSKSPITLLELGLHARSGKLRVVCTEKFYRYDNVRITCTRYGIPMYSTLQEALDSISMP